MRARERLRPWQVPEMTRSEKIEALKLELSQLQDRHREIIIALTNLEGS